MIPSKLVNSKRFSSESGLIDLQMSVFGDNDTVGGNDRALR